MKKLLSLILAAYILTSCEVQKTLVLSNIDRGATTQEYSFSIGSMEIPVVDWAGAIEDANKKCKEWGFQKAVFLPTPKKECSVPSSSGCAVYRVTYKCYCE